MLSKTDLDEMIKKANDISNQIVYGVGGEAEATIISALITSAALNRIADSVDNIVPVLERIESLITSVNDIAPAVAGLPWGP